MYEVVYCLEATDLFRWIFVTFEVCYVSPSLFSDELGSSKVAVRPPRTILPFFYTSKTMMMALPFEKLCPLAQEHVACRSM